MSLFEDASICITPTAYKAGKLYAIKPTSGAGDLDVVRATSRTRVNEQGLVEIPRTNLLLNSIFNGAISGTPGTTPTSWTNIQNTGTLTVLTHLIGSKLRFTTSGNARAIQQTISTLANTTYALSVKANVLTSNRFDFYMNVGLVSGATAQFIYNGTNVANNFVLPIGECNLQIIVVNGATAGNTIFRLGSGILGNIIGSVEIYEPQLEVGNVATEYIPTTSSIRTRFAGITQDGASASNIPALDYTNGSCPSILVEPQRTNSFTNSEGINNFSTLGRLNCTYSLGSSFNSFGSSCRVNFGTFTNNFVRAVLSYNAVSGVNNVFTLHFKKKTGFFVEISQGNATNAFVIRLNLETGQFISATGTALNNTFVRQLADDCFRVSFLTSTNATTTAGLFNVTFYNNSNFNNWTNSDANDFVLISGIQWENNVSNATSYIPTVASAVTRNADVISKTGISSLIGQTEGTIFVDFNLSTIGVANGAGIIELTPGGGVEGESNRIIIFKNNLNKQILIQIRAGGTTNIFNVIFIPPDGKVKVGIAYKSGDTILSVNGSITARSETFTFSQTLNFIKLGAYLAGNVVINDRINLAAIWKTRLTNQELAQLTTL